MATGLTAWVNLALLIRALRRRALITLTKGAVKRAMIMLGAAVAMGAGLLVMDYAMMPHFMDSGTGMRLVGLALLVGVGAAIYGFILYITGILTPSMVKELFPKGKKQDTIEDVQQLGQ